MALGERITLNCRTHTPKQLGVHLVNASPLSLLTLGERITSNT